MLNIKLEGFEEFEKLFSDAAKEDLKKVIISIVNDVPHAEDLEFGSTPGQEPWPNPGEFTELRVDIFEGGLKVVSVKGFAMLRSSLEKAMKLLEKLLSEIKLDKPIKPQLDAIFEKVGAFWLEEAKEATPEDDGEARAGWKLIK